MTKSGEVGGVGVEPEQAPGISEEAAPVVSWWATARFFGVALVLVFGAFAVGRKVNVDENVFVASAALLSRHFILPYRDYHYNHMPTLVIVYALIFRMTGYLLLGARSLSAVCAAGAATVFFHVAYRQFAHVGARRRLWFAIGIGVFFLADPIFTQTAGLAWNHDFPIFTSLLGFVVMSRGLEGRRILPLAAAGFLIGLAVTARLTFATELLPFGLFVLLYPTIQPGRRAALAAAFIAGLVIAALPSAWVWAQSPVNAYFGNFQYPALNTRWHELHDDAVHQRYTLASKLWYYLKISWELPGNGVLVCGFIALVAATLKWRRVLRDSFHFELAILVLLVASQVGAALVPSPPFLQYIYGATPFMLLAGLVCLARLPHLATDRGLERIRLGGLGIALAFAIPEYHEVPRLFWPPAWRPVEAHRIGEQIAAATGPVRVLTDNPIYVLEGGLDIYPALGTGRFGMRVGDYLSPKERERYRMWGTDDLVRLFSQRPPEAILISPGGDADIEDFYDRQAQAGGYRQIVLRREDPPIRLWLHDR